MSKKIICILFCLVLLTVLAACGTEAGNNSTYAEGDTGEIILTIRSDDMEDPAKFSLDDIKSLGVETHSYSGRNKENKNSRQVREYTGIDLKKILEAAGHEVKNSDKIRITASDGYTTEFILSEKYGLLFYDGEDAVKGTEVPVMLAIIKEGDYMGNEKEYVGSDGSPLRLVYGQADYDSATMKDFNMQGWTSYVEKIEVNQ